MDILRIIGWITAMAWGLWLAVSIRKSLHTHLAIPWMVWEDFRHPPKTAAFPIAQRTAKETILLCIGTTFGTAWIVTFALSLFTGLPKRFFLIEEIAFLGITLLHNGQLMSAVRQRLRDHCTLPEQRDAWLAFFERKHPDLATVTPLSLESTPKLFLLLATAILPILPVLFETAISGWPGMAFQLFLIAGAATIPLFLLTHWAGVIVGGRYAWWVEYHMVKQDLSTR